jgi:hypothetical protein
LPIGLSKADVAQLYRIPVTDLRRIGRVRAQMAAQYRPRPRSNRRPELRRWRCKGKSCGCRQRDRNETHREIPPHLIAAS